MATIWYCLGIQQQPHVSAWGLVGCLLCFSRVGLCWVGLCRIMLGCVGLGRVAVVLPPLISRPRPNPH